MQIIKSSRWVERKGMLPSRVVIRHRKMDNSYITHVQVKPESGGEPCFVWGHYDMSEAQALNDFDRRVKSL